MSLTAVPPPGLLPLRSAPPRGPADQQLARALAELCRPGERGLECVFVVCVWGASTEAREPAAGREGQRGPFSLDPPSADPHLTVSSPPHRRPRPLARRRPPPARLRGSRRRRRQRRRGRFGGGRHAAPRRRARVLGRPGRPPGPPCSRSTNWWMHAPWASPAARVAAFAAHLDGVLASASDAATLDAAAAAYGHLARGGGAAAAEAVEAAVRRCVDWLRSDGGGAASSSSGRAPPPPPSDRRLAAALTLRALAEAAPAVFNVHVRPFVDAVWAGLRDGRPAVRAAAASALRACLVLVEARETRYRVQWYHRLYEESRRGWRLPARPQRQSWDHSQPFENCSPTQASSCWPATAK